ncbi:methyltransferase domain-containing protein [Calidifontibacter sp. DB0510]|uniref:Methyltransferase domain-containing protein n=1 Tax=Metallococcus carri TaxID=1656884 RepID=A0A967B0J4_9MICO|nr:class I SAM-dependent methyltransferase [Metallococcus carri]NHN55198.1 methyltransferase domain-containing protein [Metallococcus carri]NOP36275.1 methyltransferase domain-containing protein [Calidifontibacter sp. DB2511S]
MRADEVRKLTAVEDRHWWYAERRHLVGQLIKDLPAGDAADIGAAGGGNTRVLLDHGWRAIAFELSPDGAQVGASRGLNVARADATKLPLADESVDLVTALDIIEHIEDDDAAVSEIRRVLRPGGTAVIAVPADPKLWSAHDVAVNHVRRYTRPALLDVLQRNGLVVEECSSWMVLLRPVVALRRKSTSGSDLDEPGALVNTALKGVVTLERYLPVRSLPGVSLWVKARRP